MKRREWQGEENVFPLIFIFHILQIEKNYFLRERQKHFLRLRHSIIHRIRERVCEREIWGEWFKYLIDIMHTHRSCVCLSCSVFAARALSRERYFRILIYVWFCLLSRNIWILINEQEDDGAWLNQEISRLLWSSTGKSFSIRSRVHSFRGDFELEIIMSRVERKGWRGCHLRAGKLGLINYLGLIWSQGSTGLCLLWAL